MIEKEREISEKMKKTDQHREGGNPEGDPRGFKGAGFRPPQKRKIRVLEEEDVRGFHSKKKTT